MSSKELKFCRNFTICLERGPAQCGHVSGTVTIFEFEEFFAIFFCKRNPKNRAVCDGKWWCTAAISARENTEERSYWMRKCILWIEFEYLDLNLLNYLKKMNKFVLIIKEDYLRFSIKMIELFL